MSLNEAPEESIYTVNFRKAWITPEYKRTNRVVGILREFARRHMKTDDIKIDQYLNRYLWLRGKRNPPRRIRVRMTKDETDTVVVSLYEEYKERKSQTEDLEVKQEVESKSQTEDLEVKQEVETLKEQPSKKKKKESEVKEQVELEESVKNEGKDASAASPDEVDKTGSEPKTLEKPKKKTAKKKKSIDQET